MGGMTALLVILLILCCWRLKLSGYHADFLSPVFSMAIKGIFTVLIFCSHVRGYITLTDNWWNAGYEAFFNRIGQLIVTLFFFYSGYGVWESQKSKPFYARTFFRRRFLKTLLHFDIAVLLFILVQLCLGIYYSGREYLLCWTGWESVGNSNWFMFVIFALYLLAQAALLLQPKSSSGAVIFMILASVALWVLLRVVAGKPSWWVNTLSVFPLGMIVSQWKEKILGLMGRPWAPYLITAGLAALFALVFGLWGVDIHGGCACLFALLVVAVSSWVEIGNPALAWLGKNAFTIYIIQRLPMIVFTSLGLSSRPALFVVLSLVTTLLLAEGLSRVYATIPSPTP